MERKLLTTFIINLRNRFDRKVHILNEFNDRYEFDIQVIEAVENSTGAIGLWESIKKIVKQAVETGEEKILICEDDHLFTGSYNESLLQEAIQEGNQLGAEVICGGVSWYQDMLPVTGHLNWTNKFSGTQFVIIYKSLFSKILGTDFSNRDSADYKLCSLTDKTFFIYPFISVQKDFGYSDVTAANDGVRSVESLFAATIARLEMYSKIKEHYNTLPLVAEDNEAYEDLSLPTYVINLPERTERLEHIKLQFENRPEFDVTIVEACKHPVGAVGLWMSIRKVIQMAVDNEDDVIIICEDDHTFTPEYSRDYLFRNLLEANAQGADYLSGGPSTFMDAVPVSANRYWVSSCQATQFVIIYRDLFERILNKEFDDTIIADLCLSGMITNKMVLWPAVSMQKDFGYSDVTPAHNDQKDLVQRLFNEARERFEKINRSRKTFHPEPAGIL